jgi:hypothetical protein
MDADGTLKYLKRKMKENKSIILTVAPFMPDSP